MARATRGDTVLAESDVVVEIEGNLYFPPDSVDVELFEPVDHTTFCPWKGTASYYDVVVDGERVGAVAWYYPKPMDGAAEIRDHVAFYQRDGVLVSR
jgi:uncharacterized protein (DUF427 family)